jgi:hypothetical protein
LLTSFGFTHWVSIPNPDLPKQIKQNPRLDEGATAVSRLKRKTVFSIGLETPNTGIFSAIIKTSALSREGQSSNRQTQLTSAEPKFARAKS